MTTSDVPPVRFAPARGARLAWQAWGTGSATIVAIPPLAQNIEVAWESPLIRQMFEGFGAFSHYLHFDKRGTGASDRRSRVPGLDERVDDLRSVMDHAGIGSAHLFVQSDGGPMALLFAATYPERVESLILFGTAASLAAPWPDDERLLRRDRMADEWGTPASRVVDQFTPSLTADQEFRTWHQRYERQSASSASLRELLDLCAEMDVTEVISELEIPTLVIHRSGDRIVPVERGRELAEAIEGARLIELPGEDHFAYVGDLEAWLPAVERFVTGKVRTSRAGDMKLPNVRILTLGRFAVEIDGEEVPLSAWGSKHARRLCKRLVAARGWPLTREEMIDMLWPDDTDMSRLGARLSVELSRARRVLGGGIIADRETIRLDTDEVATDLGDLFNATDDAAIVAAYPGEFLHENRYDDWAAPVRDEARARFVAAARRLAAREQHRGDPLRAAALARRLVEANRYDESAYRLLVESLLSAHDAGEARRAWERWSSAMVEIGVIVTPLSEITGS